MQTRIEQLLQEKSGIRLDIGCGANKNGPDWVGLDARALPGVDIVWDVTRFPWPLPAESVTVAVTSHLVEHIPPDAGDVRVVQLIKLLLARGVIEERDICEYIGTLEPGPRFIAFMNEVWRVLKYDGELAIACPHGYSPGQLQDPTHCNPLNEATWAYFDPLEPNTGGLLYRIYRPKPWRVKSLFWNPSGNMEVVLVKRREDISYAS
jgi:hypothetical protein